MLSTARLDSDPPVAKLLVDSFIIDAMGLRKLMLIEGYWWLREDYAIQVP
jgi:hypothetical protein